MSEFAPLFLVIAAFAGALVLWQTTIARRDHRAPVEQGRRPAHEELGGARFDARNWTMPFVRIAVYSDMLVISSWNQYVIPYAQLDAAEAYRGVASRGVRLRHRVPGVPSHLILWSRDAARLLETLRAQGTNIGASPPSSGSRP